MRATPAERLIAGLTIGVLTAVVLIPMGWALVTSLKTEATVITFPPTLLPSPATLDSYAAVFLQKNFAVELFNFNAAAREMIMPDGLAAHFQVFVQRKV